MLYFLNNIKYPVQPLLEAFSKNFLHSSNLGFECSYKYNCTEDKCPMNIRGASCDMPVNITERKLIIGILRKNYPETLI